MWLAGVGGSPALDFLVNVAIIPHPRIAKPGVAYSSSFHNGYLSLLEIFALGMWPARYITTLRPGGKIRSLPLYCRP